MKLVLVYLEHVWLAGMLVISLGAAAGVLVAALIAAMVGLLVGAGIGAIILLFRMFCWLCGRTE